MSKKIENPNLIVSESEPVKEKKIENPNLIVSESEPVKEKKISAMSLIRTIWQDKETVTLVELTSLTGKSDAWIQCAMSIMKNPGRTKSEKMIVTVYDRKTKSFSKI